MVLGDSATVASQLSHSNSWLPGAFSASMHMHHEVPEFPTRDSRQSIAEKGQLTVDCLL